MHCRGGCGLIGVFCAMLWIVLSFRSTFGSTDRLAKTGGSLDQEAMAALLEEISEERIRAHVEHLVYKDPSRPYDNSYDNLRTRFALRPETFEITTYLRDQLALWLGDEMVEIVPFTADIGDTMYTMYNVVGTLPGMDPSAGCYVVSAHYDATARQTEGWDWRTQPASGADDNASGVALMLEAARVLSSLRFPWSIRFVGFSGEELGTLGSRDYARSAAERGDRILGALNFDMIGYNRLVDRLHLVANAASRWMVDLMQAANERYGIGLVLAVLVDYRAIRSDHASFWFQGYDAILGIENYPPETTADSTQYIPYAAYDAATDVADSINYRLVRKCTQLCVAALAQYALEEGPPDLAIFPDDLEFSEQGDLIVTVSNLGLRDLSEGYDLRISRCDPDSTACAPFYEERRPGPLVRGGSESFRIFWEALGDAVFSVEVDPYGQIAEWSEENNRLFQSLRNVPTDRVRVYPNPMVADGAHRMTFAGLPRGTQVEIFSPSGEWIWTGKEKRREAFWAGTNDSGFLVGSGIYLYLVTQDPGILVAKGKIGVIRKW